MYGENVTPNQHQLARDYVLLDNLYCNGEVSVDGHSWCDAAIATDFNQRSWIMSYSKHGKLPATRRWRCRPPATSGTCASGTGVSYQNYGEGATACRPSTAATGSGARDMDRVDNLDRRPARGRENGRELPRFTIMSLGENHTKGTTPGAPTPDASCREQRRRAVGKIVEAASRSRFWNGDGDLRHRGRRPERPGPRGRAPHRRPGDQPLLQAGTVSTARSTPPPAWSARWS